MAYVKNNVNTKNEKFFKPRLLLINADEAKSIGRNEAQVLQQIRYWLGRSKNVIDGKTWVYKTYAEWQQEITFLSERTIRRAIRSLEDKGIILSFTSNRRFSRTKYYTLSDHMPNNEMVMVPSGHKAQKNNANFVKMDAPSGQNYQVTPYIHKLLHNNNNTHPVGKSKQESCNSSIAVVDFNFDDELTNELVGFGIVAETAKELVRRHPKEYIRSKIDLMRRSKGIVSKAAWLVAAINKNFPDVKNGAFIDPHLEAERNKRQQALEIEQAKNQQAFDQLANEYVNSMLMELGKPATGSGYEKFCALRRTGLARGTSGEREYTGVLR